jgi:hypothetical protein
MSLLSPDPARDQLGVSWIMSDRGVNTKGGREAVCVCPCHIQDMGMMHFMACCGEPKTPEGSQALRDVTQFEIFLEAFGKDAPEVTAFVKDHPELVSVTTRITESWLVSQER